MIYMNRVQVVGRVASEPKFHSGNEGKDVCFFKVITRHHDKSGVAYKTKHNIVAYGATAKLAKEYLSPGASIFVEATGRIELPTPGIPKCKSIKAEPH